MHALHTSCTQLIRSPSEFLIWQQPYFKLNANHCRLEVKAWLASIGAESSVPTKKQTGLPSLTEEQWQQLQPKTGKVIMPPKEPAAVQPKEPVAKPKEPKAKEPRDSSGTKPKGRPR